MVIALSEDSMGEFFSFLFSQICIILLYCYKHSNKYNIEDKHLLVFSFSVISTICFSNIGLKHLFSALISITCYIYIFFF